MNVIVYVVGQKLRIATDLKHPVAGTQQFIRFVFQLSDEWKALEPMAQFVQNGLAYNAPLDTTTWSCYFPSDIQSGECTMALYGNVGDVIGVTNAVTLNVLENNMITQ